MSDQEHDKGDIDPSTAQALAGTMEVPADAELLSFLRQIQDLRRRTDAPLVQPGKVPPYETSEGKDMFPSDDPLPSFLTGEPAPAKAPPGITEPEPEDRVALPRLRMLRIDEIRPSRGQPRQTFDEGELQALSESIRDRGILQPVLVRRVDDELELIAGERRWRAARMAGAAALPGLVINGLSDQEAAIAGLLENTQRADLNALEEAHAYAQLIEKYGLTQDQVAQCVGRSRSYVANMLRLMHLPEPVKVRLAAGELSTGHARALLGSDDPSTLAERVVEGGLNVRQTEALATAMGEIGAAVTAPDVQPADPAATAPANRAAADRLAEELRVRLGLPVKMDLKKRKGKLTIEFKSLVDLVDALERLNYEAKCAAEIRNPDGDA